MNAVVARAQLHVCKGAWLDVGSGKDRTIGQLGDQLGQLLVLVDFDLEVTGVLDSGLGLDIADVNSTKGGLAESRLKEATGEDH